MNGTNPGDMYYWDGTNWIIIPIGTQGQNLTICNGVPTWGPCPVILPILTTTTVSSIGGVYAVSGGNITYDGSATVTARGVCYSTSPNATTSNSFTMDGTGGGIFVSTMNNLLPNRTYYVKAYAVNSVGIAYGGEVSFTTNQVYLPTVTTTTITGVTNASASGGGNIISDGGAPITARGVLQHQPESKPFQ